MGVFPEFDNKKKIIRDAEFPGNTSACPSLVTDISNVLDVVTK